MVQHGSTRVRTPEVVRIDGALISVVIPAFNEAAGVERCLHETVAVLEQLGGEYEVVLVDDGSEDGTADLARRTANRLRRVRVLGHEVNRGKGSALARGAYAAVGDYVLFLDADMEVHPRQLALLWETLQREDADVVIGSKLHPQSSIEYPRGRRLISFGYYLLVRTLFRLPVHDTQTGLKLYKRDVLVRVVPRLLVKRFAHDLEALVNVHRLGYRIVEAPVVVTRQRPYPRIGWGDVFRVGLDTLAIWYRTYVLRYYDRVGRETDRLLAESPQFHVGDEALEEFAS
jgi:glycosyltransferase involved in cell wall biosynthesis